jgi:hypothetical protein
VIKAVALAVFALLVASASAQPIIPIPAGLCPSLFPSGGVVSSTGVALGNASTYSSIVSISLLVVLMMLTILGITYAFGIAFNVDSLKAFTRSEFAESIFSLALIIVLGLSLAFSGAIISFISNIGLASMQTLPSGSQLPTTSITSTGEVYLKLCNSYLNEGVNTLESNWPATFISLELEEFIRSFSFKTGDLGVTFTPFAGIYPLKGLINGQIEAFYAMTGLLIALTFFLYIVYTIFPLFLYLGLLLRSLPWTRAAGGSFIAIFIAFYIVFPSILYPFSLYMYSANAYTPLTFGSQTSWTSSLFSLNAISSIITSLLSTSFSGSALLAEIDGFAQQGAAVALQMLGVLIALVISFDLVESFGDLLGSPSLQSRKLLGKLI